MADGPRTYFTLPKYGPWPDQRPAALPPPVSERSFRSPFGITPDVFHFVLRPEVPITFAFLYVLSVFFLNAWNRDRKEKNGGQPKPWRIARSPAFQYFVVIHNALLTLYSAATFLAMFRAAIHTWPSNISETGAAGLADAFCKMNGPRGLGDAATYNTTLNIWESKNSLIRMGVNGSPDPTDVGRLWNEGLAFWGWWFYVSKFYEVIDTLIILANGKRSPTLQTYHHAGAMLCMWAGIRYMSPPIWMFVFVNSFIHALMYTYFTLSALKTKVPVTLKRALTTMQIMQLIWGSVYAASHLFIQYDIPIATPFRIATYVKAAVSSASSVAVAMTSSVSSIVESPLPTADYVSLAKKLLLRAVGEEGIAELVGSKPGQPLAAAMQEKIEQFNQQTLPTYETRWRTDLTKIDCLDTPGQAFAIYLNLLYLAPLTFLFLRFFVKSYTNRAGGKPDSAPDTAKRTIEAGREAAQKTSNSIEDANKWAEDQVRKLDGKDIQEQLRKDIAAIKAGTFDRGRRVSSQVQDFERQVRAAAEKAKAQGQKLMGGGTGGSKPSSRRGSPVKKEIKSEGASKDDGTGEEKPTYAEVARPDAEKDDANAPPAPASAADGNTGASKLQSQAAADDDDEDKENQPPTSQSESESKQDDNLAASQATRPGASASGEESMSASKIEDDDTDAMGKSGAIVDFVADKAKEMADQAEDAAEETGEEGAKGDKPLFRPPGAATS